MHLPTHSHLLSPHPRALALPTTPATTALDLSTRQSCYVQCGNTCYTSAQVSAARSAGAGYVRAGDTAGSSSYPHRYNNYEGFEFLVGGTYYEFPLVKSGVYSGGGFLCSSLRGEGSGEGGDRVGRGRADDIIIGSPGADRVVFTSSGQRAGEITHTGASGNNFVACSGW